jgi:cytochrome P450
MVESALVAPGTRRVPGPKGLPLVGSLLEAWANPLDMMTRGAREHGDIVKFRFAWMQYYLLNAPVAAHRVLVENAKAYHKSPNYQGLKIMLGQGLLTSEGEFWRRQRRLAQPAFHRDKIASFVDVMASCTNDMLDRWEREHPGVLDVHGEMMRLTLRIVGKTLLSADLEADAKQFGEALNVAIKWANEYVESIVRVPPSIPTPKNLRFRRAQGLIESVVMRVVDERRRTGEDKADLLSMLMGSEDETSGEVMSDRQLKDELLTLTLAGHETTANALSFTFDLLSRHPDVLRRLRAEVSRVLGGRSPRLEDLAQMPYTKAVIEESLRLYPPAWVFERIALEDDEVLGYRIPKGSIVAVAPWVIHRNPELWPNPEGFDPERFLKPDPNRHKLAYIPFGAGPRTCIGNVFALTEMQVLLPLIVQRASLELLPGTEIDLDPSITLRPKKGLPMAVRPNVS